MLTRSIILVVSLVASGCRVSSSSGELDHVLGQTRRAPAGEFKDCQQNEEFASQASELRDFVVYLRALAVEIARANPQTFSGDYDITKFCFAVVKGDTNAYARPDSRLVVFRTDIFKIFDTDATAASVMAHELAHVTMQHSLVPHDKLANNATWRQLKDEIGTLVARKTSIEAKTDPLRDRVTAVQQDLAARASAEEAAAREALDAEAQSLSERIFKLTMALAPNDDPSDLFATADAIIPALPRTISARPIPATLRGISKPDIAETWRQMAAAIQAFNAKVKAQNEKEAATNGALWQELSELDATLAALDRDWISVDGSIASLSEKISNIESDVLGTSQQSANEEEADDVGFELYLRAGFQPAYFSDLFPKLEVAGGTESQIAQCRADLAARSAVPQRGTASHPSACWRVYNATIQEMDDHQAEYRNLIQSATKRNIIPGKIEALRAKLPR